MFGEPLMSLVSHCEPVGAFGPYADRDALLCDQDIRIALSGNELPIPLNRPVVVEEVRCWRGYVRADYLAASPSAVAVVEIKSDRDTLSRFGEQIRVYSAIADRVTLVVGWSLAASALRAAPRWWDVVLAERDVRSADGVRFVPMRDGRPNSDISPAALVAMLPLDQVRLLAREAGLSASVRSVKLRHSVTTLVSFGEIRTAMHNWLVCLARQRLRTADEQPLSLASQRAKPIRRN